MINILSDSLKSFDIGISGTAFSRIVDSSKCARTRGGLETIILLILDDYIGKQIENEPLIFDKFLKILDDQIEQLKESWADNHIVK